MPTDYCRCLVLKGIDLFEHLRKADSIPLIRRATTVNHEAFKEGYLNSRVKLCLRWLKQFSQMSTPHSDNVNLRSVIPFDGLSFFDYSIYTVHFLKIPGCRCVGLPIRSKCDRNLNACPVKGGWKFGLTLILSVFRLRAKQAAPFWKSRHLCNDPAGYPELLSHSLRNHPRTSCINVRKGNCYYSLPFSIRMSQSRLTVLWTTTSVTKRGQRRDSPCVSQRVKKTLKIGDTTRNSRYSKIYRHLFYPRCSKLKQEFQA